MIKNNYKTFTAIVATNNIDFHKAKFSKKCLEQICSNSINKLLLDDLHSDRPPIGYVVSSKIRNNCVINKFKIYKDKFKLLTFNTPVLFYIVKKRKQYKNHHTDYAIGAFGFYLSPRASDEKCRIISLNK
ncbi:MAG: hypothetical protein PHU05_04985 [Bacilli bacterium]|nr:hypothetical protein [Bacilli bacterium]